MSLLKLKLVGARLALLLFLVTVALISGCEDLMHHKPEGDLSGMGLSESRAGFSTTLIEKNRDAYGLPVPDVDFVSLVEYPTPIGGMKAYLASIDSDSAPRSRPAMIWIMGGLPPGVADASVWQDSSSGNDQSAKSYWKNGFVTMYPSLRGSAGNPGFQEGFYGEVDDVLAAYDYLAADTRVDPKKIYLGGHSTGATLVLLVAAATNKFAGVLSLGPVSDPADYGESAQLHDRNNPKEAALRSPINFINKIRIPTLIVEGEQGNYFSLIEMSSANDNNYVRIVAIQGADHFNHLAKSNDMIAAAIIKGEGISSLSAKRFQSTFNK
jgi:alpha/beta superfamily hydrolase